MLLLALGLMDPPPVDWSVRSVQGLKAAFAGVPVVRSSWFQYIEPDWSRSYYSSQWNHQKIETQPTGDVVMRFSSGDKMAFGTQTFQKLDNGVRVNYEFFWSGPKPVMVELGAATLWGTPLRIGSVFIDGTPTRSLATRSYASEALTERQYGPAGQAFYFDTPFGRLTARGSGTKWVLYDARGVDQPWVDDQDVWWFGAPRIIVRPNEPSRASVEWTFEPKALRPSSPSERVLSETPLDRAVEPPEPNFDIIPKPKEAKVDASAPFVLDDDLSIDLPDRLMPFQKEFVHFVKLLWNVDAVKATGRSQRIFTRIEDRPGIPAEGYEIWINRKTAIIRGEDEMGLRHALRTLAQLVFVRNGKLCLPTATIKDWPSTDWRGVHLFVGPNAYDFHERLWENVLAPLKFNKAVIQCERTAWEATRGIETELTGPKEQLARLFQFYRTLGVEPIPLIQSFGHMDWLFANGKNLELSAHEQSPYRIDPNNPKAQAKIEQIWDEAIALLKPKTVHFGLDEVDARSFKEDPELITRLWERHLPFLGLVAQKNGVNMMLWGDKGLAKGEGIDAAHGDGLDQARRRRLAIPSGSFIADWHYKNDPKPDRFLTSLQIWSQLGHKPIASTWFNPDNIRGFYRAAVQHGAGTLQTTWAGHVAGEGAMLREFRQFSAMVLAADYAWSGRTELPSQLGYKPDEVFARMFFGARSELDPVRGSAWGVGARQKFGELNFVASAPIELYSVLRPSSNPDEVMLRAPSGARGKEVAMLLDTAIRCNANDPVAKVEIVFSDGRVVEETLVYGRHLRSADDRGPTVFGHRERGLTAWRKKVSESPTPITAIRLKALSTYAGLRVHAITVF